MSTDLKSFAKSLAEKPLLITHRRSADCQRLVVGDKISLSKVSEVMALEPGLCMLALRYVNRIRAKSNKRFEINSLANACNLMGEIALKKMIKSAPVLESKVENEALRADYCALIDRSIHAAHYAHDWASIRKDASPHEVKIAALLRDVGELAVCIHHYDSYCKIKQMHRQNPISLACASTKILGFTFLQLSKALAKHWFLPDVVRDGMTLANWHLYRPQGVMLASELASNAEFGWYHRDMHHCKELLAQYLNVELGKASAELHRSTLKLARSDVLQGAPIYAARLVQLPYEKATVPAAKKVDSSAANRPAQTSKKPTKKIPTKPVKSKVYAQCAQQIKMRAASGGANVSDLLKLMLQGLHSGLDLQRVAFAMCDSERKCLNVKLAKGMKPELANNIAFPCVGNTLYSALLKGPKSIWINEGNFAKFRPLIPDAVIKQTKSKSFIATSIFSANKPLGVVYADCLGGQQQLDAGTYQQAKSLVLFTGKAITLVDAARRAAEKRRQQTNSSTGTVLLKKSSNKAAQAKHPVDLVARKVAGTVKAAGNQALRRS